MFAPAREHEHDTEASLGHEPFHVETALPSGRNQRSDKRMGVEASFHSPYGHPVETHT